MTLLPFGNLPVHTPRQLVPTAIDLGDWNAIAPLFAAVEKRISDALSAAELERALLDWSEIPWEQLAFRPVRHTLEYYFADRKNGNFDFRICDLSML